MKASIVICTHNRAASLGRTLETLTLQALKGLGGLEILVVDNNCSDDTEAVVRSFTKRLPIRSCRETKLGLGHARNRGVRDSCGDTVVFAKYSGTKYKTQDGKEILFMKESDILAVLK